MNVKVKIGQQEIQADATSLPLRIEAEGIRSQNVLVFFLNGTEYRLFVSKGGKLVTSK